MNKIIKSDLRQARQILALYKYLVGEAHETYKNLQRQERAATRRVRELEGRLKRSVKREPGECT